MDSEQLPAFEPAAAHPGALVAEYLDLNGWSQNDLARRTSLTPKTISEICNGKSPITPQTALALERVLQRPAHLWLNLQRHYDEAQARQRDLDRSATWEDWLKSFPIAEMKKLKMLPNDGRRSDLDELLGFLGVSSPGSWKSVWDSAGIAYRQTRRFQTSDQAISVWIRATEIMASKLDVAHYDETRLRGSLNLLRACTLRRADEILEPVQNLCAAAGVAVVLVPGLKHTGISGCARWLSEKKAVIALTLRYKTDDQMWFTLFHELGHLLLHKRQRAFVLDNADEDLVDRVVDPEMQRFEDEANRFAADTLIPPEALSVFIEENDFRSDAIHDFAEKVGIGPGLVVGRLQFEGILASHQGNRLKQKLDFQIAEEDAKV